jgi:hypothetical protein
MPLVSGFALVMPPKIAFTKLMPKLFNFLPLYAHDFWLYPKPLCKTPLPDLCQTFYFLPHLCCTFQFFFQSVLRSFVKRICSSCHKLARSLVQESTSHMHPAKH